MKKKHLSQIVIGRTFLAILGTFLALMVVTCVLFFIHGERRAGNFVRSSLEDIEYYSAERVDDYYGYWIGNDAFLADEYIENAEKNGKPIQDAVKLLCVDATGDLDSAVSMDLEKACLSEISIVDPDGIIVGSTEPGCIGFDIHSDKEMAEFLCLLDGNPDGLMIDGIPNPATGTLMKYYGALIPDYGGILLNGLDAHACQERKELILIDDLKILKVGGTGYYIYLDKDLKILSGPGTVQEGELFTLAYDIRKLAESGAVMNDRVYGVPSFVGVRADDQEYIVSVYPAAEAFETWNILILTLLIIYAVTFTILYILINRLLEKKVVLGVFRLNSTLGRIAEGRLDEKADFRNSLEFDRLSDGINDTVGRLKDLIREAEGRIDSELALASRIQTSYLPREFPPFTDRNEFELYASMVPARDVGGDFYDYFLIDDDHLALVIADVSGKGIPAALFMAAAINKIRRSLVKYGTDVAEAVKEVNQELFEENEEFFFVTAWIGVVTIPTGHVDYADAGHDYPAVYRRGEEFRIEEGVRGLPLAVRKNAKVKAGSFELGAEDILYLYTDGVTEATDPEGEMFRIAGMLEVLNQNREASVSDIDAAVRAAITAFAKEAPQFDDMTTLCFRYQG